jgi:hypothetical protein
VNCSSGGYNLSYCPVNGQIQSARLVNQQSAASCQLGNSWGWQGNTIWVNRGCRGTFVVYTY